MLAFGAPHSAFSRTTPTRSLPAGSSSSSRSSGSQGSHKSSQLRVTLSLPLACTVCLDKVKSPVLCPNRHVFCEPCLTEWQKVKSQCPVCRVQFDPQTPLLRVLGASIGDAAVDVLGETALGLKRTRIDTVVSEYEAEIRRLEVQVKELEEKCSTMQSKERIRTQDPDCADMEIECGERDRMDDDHCDERELDVELVARLRRRVRELTVERDRREMEARRFRNEIRALHQAVDAPPRASSRPISTNSTRPRPPTVPHSPTPASPGLAAAGLRGCIEKLQRENAMLKASLQKSDEYIETLHRKLAEVGLE
ncbi:hypothetical protein BDK51DRAFT_34017 [Blyttiomyces helicus]|uniref:RING-type domain-containing protein n=1 Tax=Blyttiomyces helicus TaxID=388810 RepID=A0A4P9WDG5_9FUNG|nr:hypothetical protein BDK51DRAFT_34017 [Blyttiomyces helicus]|eukprot:RKO90584.1 hypothetical protein BDK51DRAFT_34017 [Blyttiomyces helicus]